MYHYQVIGHKRVESFVFVVDIWRTAVESEQNPLLSNFNEIILVTSDSFWQLKF